jgi:hypothetical protein
MPVVPLGQRAAGLGLLLLLLPVNQTQSQGKLSGQHTVHDVCIVIADATVC